MIILLQHPLDVKEAYFFYSPHTQGYFRVFERRKAEQNSLKQFYLVSGKLFEQLEADDDSVDV